MELLLIFQEFMAQFRSIMFVHEGRIYPYHVGSSLK